MKGREQLISYLSDDVPYLEEDPEVVSFLFVFKYRHGPFVEIR